MAESGWVKLHRKITECFIWEDSEPFDKRSAWMDLVMMVNHEDKQVMFNGKLITVKRGQRVTSMHKLSERWHWSRTRVKSYLTLLEKAGMITTETTTLCTTITLVKYDTYQSQQTTDHTTDCTTDHTTDHTTHLTQTRMIKNDKEEKKKKGKISTFGNYEQREAQEDDIYTILSRKGNKG